MLPDLVNQMLIISLPVYFCICLKFQQQQPGQKAQPSSVQMHIFSHQLCWKLVGKCSPQGSLGTGSVSLPCHCLLLLHRSHLCPQDLSGSLFCIFSIIFFLIVVFAPFVTAQGRTSLSWHAAYLTFCDIDSTFSGFCVNLILMLIQFPHNNSLVHSSPFSPLPVFFFWLSVLVSPRLLYPILLTLKFLTLEISEIRISTKPFKNTVALQSFSFTVYQNFPSSSSNDRTIQTPKLVNIYQSSWTGLDGVPSYPPSLVL